ncbi:uncharacterized protein ASPGLDRAFT_399405 [Aspergillus glaucus CBS 516.65]|uniref:Uncharacterized protein n=1 Tax=Aspergillus glaucus CBS 516.65 TaxID=1160497 RepID=A0A1L9VHR6_ASPGL|nr:hypothetical protein ASPGLDRAFT_399405 [Aspergillus glaucus CBS 516.65]OJJ83440.1 hypothetical protein ASPGLDRAFT_399405 [Aspergillus glaucus CBS 516.65]
MRYSVIPMNLESRPLLIVITTATLSSPPFLLAYQSYIVSFYSISTGYFNQCLTSLLNPPTVRLTTRRSAHAPELLLIPSPLYSNRRAAQRTPFNIRTNGLMSAGDLSPGRRPRPFGCTL